MSIGKNIKTLRKEKKLTQEKLAEKAKMSRSYLADVEGDRYNPSIETLRSIAEALGTTLAALTDEEDFQYQSDKDEPLRKLHNILGIISNEEGYIHEEIREDVFNAILNSGLYMAYAYHNASDNKNFEDFFSNYFNSNEEFSESEHREAAIQFNLAYDTRNIKTAFLRNDHETQELFNKELEKVVQNHNLKNSNANSYAEEFVRELDLSDEDLLSKYLPKMDGVALDEEEIQELIAYLRVKRQMKSLK